MLPLSPSTKQNSNNNRKKGDGTETEIHSYTQNL